MIQYKLVQLLKIINKEELRKLHKFLRSPYFNYSQPVILLFEVLRKHHPDFKSASFKQEKIWKKLYADQPYNDDVFRKWIFKLTQLVERFLTIEELEKESQDKEYLLLKSLGNRTNYKLFQKLSKDLKESLDKTSIRDMDYYRQSFHLNYEQYFHSLHDKYNLKDGTLEEMEDHLDSFYTLAKLRLKIAAKNREKILNLSYEARMQQGIQEAIKGGLLKDNIIVALYQVLGSLMDKEAIPDFFKLKNQFFENIDFLRQTDQVILFFSGLNFCIQQMNRGNKAFRKEVFDWYRNGLDLPEILLENGQIHEYHFNNIVSLGCQEKEFLWVQQFLKEYEPNLNELIRADALHYSKGLWNYYSSNYDEALQVLWNHSFSRSYQLKVRLLTIRTIFEQFLKANDYYDLLSSNLKAFENFIRRDEQFNKVKIERILNFIKLLNRLSKKIIDQERSSQIQSWLKKELTIKKPLALRDWLTKKAESF